MAEQCFSPFFTSAIINILSKLKLNNRKISILQFAKQLPSLFWCNFLMAYCEFNVINKVFLRKLLFIKWQIIQLTINRNYYKFITLLGKLFANYLLSFFCNKSHAYKNILPILSLKNFYSNSMSKCFVISSPKMFKVLAPFLF